MTDPPDPPDPTVEALPLKPDFSGTAFALIVETIPQLVWCSRDLGMWTWCSPQWTRFTGQTAAAAIGLGWLDAIHPDDRTRTMEAWQQADAIGHLEVEHRIRHAETGAYRWFETRALPLDGGDRAVVAREWFGTGTDVHDLKTLQEQQALLLGELQHRVRNALAAVRVIARRSAETSESIEDYAMHLDGRLGAVSRLQSTVIRNPAAGIGLAMLVADELNACRAREGVDYTLEGPTVLLASRTADRLGLALHELATNAVKFGALAHPGGRIAVSWRSESAEGGPHLALDWHESGLNLDPEAERRAGFGLDVLQRMLPHDLRARTTVSFAATGLRCSIVIPRGDPAQFQL